MYKRLVPLKPAEHANLRLLPVTDFSFTRDELTAPVLIDEIADVAREYPLVFPIGSAMPVALLGVEKGANAYVGVEGSWLAAYIPAHIRHYPLALTRLPAAGVPDRAAKANKASAKGKTTKGKEAASTARDAAGEAGANLPRFAVLLDVGSPFVSDNDGEPVFDADGNLGGQAQQKLRILELMQNRAAITKALVQAIDKAGLLTERTIRIQRSGEPDRQVTGIRVIDETKLNQLDDAAFNQLRKSGALPLVYASLLSWANFRQGPIGKSHPLPTLQGPLVPTDDDVIRFS